MHSQTMNQAQFFCRTIKRLCNSGEGLPAEYQQVEYLRADGNQYIITSVSNAPDQTIYVKFRKSSNHARVFGNIVKELDKSYTQIYIDGGVGYYIKNNSDVSSPGKSSPTFYDNSIYEVIVHPSTTVTINNVDYTNSAVYGGASASVPICLYSNQTDTTVSRLRGDIFNFIIYQSGSKIIDLIPCYRKTDNKPGMYDLVTKTFFTNAGTGEFTVGNNV